MTLEIIARYGFNVFISSEEFEKIKFPSEFYDLTISNGEKEKSKRLERIKDFLDRILSAYNWKNATVTKVESTETGKKVLKYIKSKEKVKIQLCKLSINVVFIMENKLKYILRLL